jgi:hypothetical protein
VLQQLQRALKCKEIWVEGAHAFPDRFSFPLDLFLPHIQKREKEIKKKRYKKVDRDGKTCPTCTDLYYSSRRFLSGIWSAADCFLALGHHRLLEKLLSASELDSRQSESCGGDLGMTVFGVRQESLH